MLPSKYRFHSRGGVNAVHSQGKRVHSDYFSLTHLSNNRGGQRYAVIVSKKIAKSAVVRNRIRRRIYEILRQNLASLPAKTDCLLQVKNREVLSLSPVELAAAIAVIFARAS